MQASKVNVLLVCFVVLFLVICPNQLLNLSPKNQFVVCLHKAMEHDKDIPEFMPEPEVVYVATLA